MYDYVARWLVRDWHEASDEAKADPRQYGPMTREATAEAFKTLDMLVPAELARVASDEDRDG